MICLDAVDQYGRSIKPFEVRAVFGEKRDRLPPAQGGRMDLREGSKPSG
jgi:hypothetical protein